MVRSLHERCPATDVVLLVDITATFNEQLCDVDPSRHGGEHERGGAVLEGARVALADVYVQDVPNTLQVTWADTSQLMCIEAQQWGGLWGRMSQ